MTIPSWPSDLPRPERPTWQRQPQDGRWPKQSDAGPMGHRRRFSGVAETVQMSVLLSRSEREVFDSFYKNDCAHGSLTFYMPDPATEGWALLTETGEPLLTENGTPLLMSAQWLCLWGEEPPSEAVQGIEFRKTFSVVVLP